MAAVLSAGAHAVPSGGSASIAGASAEDRSTQLALARLALRNARRTIVPQMLAMALVGGLGWTHGAPVAALVTVGLALVVGLWRLALARAAQEDGEASTLSPEAVTRSLTANALLAGIKWMIATITILPLLGPTEAAVYLLIVCGSLVVAAGFLPFAGHAYTVLLVAQVLGLVIALTDGSNVWSLFTAALCLVVGRSLMVTARFYRDTIAAAIGATAQARQALDELQRARDAEQRASEAKTRFLATMSHEIRTPMNGVLGAIDLLRRSGLTPPQRALAATAASSSESLLRIVNDVLDHAQLESGRLSLVPRPTDLARLAGGVVRLFQPCARAKGLRLELGTRLEAGRQVLVDGARLKQVLMNLVGNAVKFTREGAITVELSAVRAGPGPARVVLHVRDTGVGIGAEAQQRLFEPFFQDPAAMKHGGSGLGLSICQRIVRQMGGTITAQSAPGAGTVFQVEVTLPVVEAPADDEPRESNFQGLDTAGVQGRVLLVDDNDVNRIIGTEMLCSLGLEVVVAVDGDDALEKLARGCVDLVLMDVEMPMLDGHSAARMQRERERQLGLARTPILALTARAFTEDVAAALDAGMDGHVAKPFTRAQLHAALAPWLGGI